jgi:hypothetical protein
VVEGVVIAIDFSSISSLVLNDVKFTLPPPILFYFINDFTHVTADVTL